MGCKTNKKRYTTNIMKRNEHYLSPELTVISVVVEAGFSVSDESDYGYPGENPDWNDFGEF